MKTRNVFSWARTALCGFLSAGLLGAPVAHAAPATTERAVGDGVDRVYHDYSGEGDASSLELNPALISAVKGLDLTLLGYQTTNALTRGQGFGGFAAVNLGFGLGLALGAQTISPQLRRNTFDFAADRNPPVTKLSLGLSAGLGEQAAFGVGVHGLRNQGVWLQRPDIDIGLMTRMTNYASLGAVARLGPSNLRSETLPSQMSVIGELAFRPLGTRHIELAGGVKQIVLEADPGQATSRLGTPGLLGRGRLAFRYHGIALRGEVEQVRTTVLDEATFAPLREEKALRGAVSMELSWDMVSAGTGIHVGVADSGVDGVGFHARVHSRRKGRVFWPRQVDVERINLGQVSGQHSLIAVLQRLERARKGGKRTILLMDCRNVGTGWASLHEIRDSLVRIRNAGGHVFAYLENTDLADYYVASAAEKIFIHPAGGLETYGLGSQSLYFKRALAKLGVRAEVLKIREYKSAGERFSEDGPSAADKEQRQNLQGDIYAQIVYDIARSRGISKQAVRELIDDAPYGPDTAIAKGLVDEISHRDELTENMSEDVGAKVTFHTFSPTNHQDETWSKAPYVGVVLIEDAIVDGESRTIPFLNIHYAGGDTIAATLRKLRADRACKGIVLRVDSPGGSALASDIIWREVSRTQEAFDKDPKGSPPIVVSMGDVAASGGYYVAMGAKTVLADPMTITGSIGVISIHFDVSGLLEKLGISVSSIQHGKNANIQSIYKPFSDDQRDRLTASMQRTYDLFTSRVAEARGMDAKKVNELGRGHVYSGRDAKALGLVDGYGGLDDAIALLRRKAQVRGFRNLEIRVVPKAFRLLDLILDTSGDPFAGAGPIRKAVARRAEAKKAASLQGVMPKALNAALARLPLSLLFVPQDEAQVLMPYNMGWE